MALEQLSPSLISDLVQKPAVGTRREVTLKALFEARTPRREFALNLNYAFQTTDGVYVYAFDRHVLKANRYSEDLSSRAPDVRNAFTRPGWYTLGHPRKATIEWSGKYWTLVDLDRADSKEGGK